MPPPFNLSFSIMFNSHSSTLPPWHHQVTHPLLQHTLASRSKHNISSIIMMRVFALKFTGSRHTHSEFLRVRVLRNLSDFHKSIFSAIFNNRQLATYFHHKAWVTFAHGSVINHFQLCEHPSINRSTDHGFRDQSSGVFTWGKLAHNLIHNIIPSATNPTSVLPPPQITARMTVHQKIRKARIVGRSIFEIQVWDRTATLFPSLTYRFLVNLRLAACFSDLDTRSSDRSHVIAFRSFWGGQQEICFGLCNHGRWWWWLCALLRDFGFGLWDLVLVGFSIWFSWL